MTTESKRKNDNAWQQYLDKKGLQLDGTSYDIVAAELEKLGQHQPRLMAKFDTPAQLPKPLRDADYTLLPIRNGKYKLFRGNIFVDVPGCKYTSSFTSKMSFRLKTAGRGSGESQYIDHAFNTGILADFLNLDEMYLTIRGRERTGNFGFRLGNVDFDVDGVQIEVDAGYESMNDIALIEAKVGIPDYFNVRQIYYPYRHFKSLVPEKRVRNMFLVYDLPSASYQLYEYIFPSLYDPLSVELNRCTIYKLAAIPHLGAYELLDVRLQTNVRDTLPPQANDLNKVLELLTLVDAGNNTSEEIADYFAFDPRQSSYYRSAAEYLGLVRMQHVRSRYFYELTDLGAQFLSTSADEQTMLMAKIVINSWIFVDLLNRCRSTGLITNTDIEAVMSSARQKNGGSYGLTTVRRRADTVRSWIDWLAREVECFEKTNNGYRLK